MRYLLMMAIAVLATGAFAQGKRIEGLPIKLGDSVEAVRAALGTTLEPDPAKSALPSGAKQLRLKTKGIWVFFDSNDRTYTIRLDAPFAGNVAGVKIGDPRAFLVKSLGEPPKVVKLPGKGPAPYLYYLDDTTTVRFDFDQDDKISSIYIFK